jgi:hypothetical protein
MRDFAGRQNGVAKRADAQRYVNPRFDEIDISVGENDINAKGVWSAPRHTSRRTACRELPAI